MQIDRIITKFEQIHKNISIIKKNLPNDEIEFSQLGLIKDGIYKRYEYSVELILDITAMLNSYYKLGIPNNNLDIINNLKKKSILSPTTCEIIKGMKSFRNVLVHVYDKLNDRLAFHNIQENLNDFSIVENEVIQFIKKDINE